MIREVIEIVTNAWADYWLGAITLEQLLDVIRIPMCDAELGETK